MDEIRVDFSVDDLTRADLLAFLGRIHPMWDAGSRPVRVDCTSTGYLGPAAAVVLASELKSREGAGARCEIALPAGPPALSAFCDFSGLRALVEAGAKAPDPAHARNETAPLRVFHRTNWGDSGPLVDLVHRHLTSVDTDSLEILRLAYQEIAQNIEDHAQSPIGGICCGRFLSGSAELRIAVVDRGLGIPATLRDAGIAAEDDADALAMVIRGNVTSRSRANNQGQGISNLALIAAGAEGKLLLASRRGMAEVVGDPARPRLKVMDHEFPGTLVVFSMRVATG